MADASRRRRSAARAARNGVLEVFRTGRTFERRGWRDHGETAGDGGHGQLPATSDPEYHVRRIDRRQTFQRHAGRPRHRRDHRRRESEGGSGFEDGRAVAAALRHPAEGRRDDRVGGRRKGAGDGPRAARASAGRGREARLDRRVVRQGRPGPGEDRPEGKLHRGRVRARRARHPRGAAAEGQLGKTLVAAVSCVGQALRVHARRGPDVERAAGRHRQCRHGDGGRRNDHRSRLRDSVSGPYGACPRARHGGSVERPDDDLLQRHEVVRPAQRRRAIPADAARTGTRRLARGSAGVRPHGGRRCGIRGGVSGEGARTPSPRAVDARRRDGLGHERTRVRGEDARRPRRAGQSRCGRLRRAGRRLQPRRLQRA